ncbi:MAG TPA: NADH-quinone oxidoreductase subunit H [Candidatus Methylomirabilis sp.]|nr:NADH-quinone oxidoreductase subunit H [Candidatus Methylomirabilis sp.]
MLGAAVGYAFAVLVWPGLLGAAALGWLYLWIARKLTARLQGRQGPPFYQPFFDFVKLMGKQTVVPGGVNERLFRALPIVSVTATTLALVIVPVPGYPAWSFSGDLVLLIYLLEVPMLCDVLAGYVTRSIYAQVSATREAVMSLGYNVPFLAAVIAMAQRAGSFRLEDLQQAPIGPVWLFAAVAFLLAVPARVKSNPFSIANAEQEIVGGSHLEYSGSSLAMFELSHALEVVVLVNLFTALFVPAVGAGALAGAVLYLAVSVALVAAVTLVAATTARLRVGQAFRFYWVWGGLAGSAAIVAAVIR